MLNRIPWPLVVVLALIAVAVAAFQVSNSLSYGRPPSATTATGPPTGGPAAGFTPEQLRRREEAAKKSKQEQGKPANSQASPS